MNVFFLSKRRGYYNALLGIWLTSIALYLFVPLHTSFNYGLFVTEVIVYITAIFCYYKLKGKSNYFDFDTLFIAFCSVEHFMGFLYVNTEEFDMLFYRGIDTTLVIKGSLLAFVGMTSYMVGAARTERNTNLIREKAVADKQHKVLPTGLLFALFVVCYAIFIYFGGLSYFAAQYKEGVGVVAGNARIFQMISLMTVFSNIICAKLILDYLQHGKFPKFGWIILGVTTFIGLQVVMVGNRTVFSYLLLPYILCFFAYVKNMNLIKTSVVLVIGVIAMYAIQIIRQGGDTYSTSLFRMLSDVIVPSQTFLASLEYVDKFGLNYGQSFLPSLFGLIPGLATFIGDSAKMGSAEILTGFLYDGSNNSGMGTTIIADIYLSFGFVGVIILMYFLGCFVHKTWKNTMNDMLIQVSLFSTCVFMGRSAYLSPLRLIVWSIIICWILTGLYSNGKNKNNSVLPR